MKGEKTNKLERVIGSRMFCHDISRSKELENTSMTHLSTMERIIPEEYYTDMEGH